MQPALKLAPSRHRLRIAVVWTNFGPYHMARIQALARCFDVVALELAGSERLYGWQSDRTDIPAEFETIQMGTWEEQSHIKTAFRLFARLGYHQPVAVLVPGWASAPALAAGLWCRTRRLPAILMSESNQDDHPRKKIVELLKGLLIRSLFDRAVVGGTRAMKYLAELGIRQSRIGFGYDSVDNDFYGKGVNAIRAVRTQASPYFLYVGRLAPEKNLFALLEAFWKYRSMNGNWGLVLVGDGPLASKLKAEVGASEYGSSVTLAGHKNSHDLLPYYAFAGCFVLPSIREPWGLVINEAMAAELPVIASKRCGSADDLIEEGRNGYTFDPTRGDQLSELMNVVATKPRDLLKSMGERSAQIVRRFSPDFWASEVARLLDLSKG